jgi:hypothetical protein
VTELRAPAVAWIHLLAPVAWIDLPAPAAWQVPADAPMRERMT